MSLFHEAFLHTNMYFRPAYEDFDIHKMFLALIVFPKNSQEHSYKNNKSALSENYLTQNWFKHFNLFVRVNNIYSQVIWFIYLFSIIT